ncbi:MAG: hypothetical protein ABI785_13335 [Gemmatimonadales bacterium]
MRALTTLITGALLLGASAAMADGGRGEFDEHDAYALTKGEKVKTDCKINYVDDRGTKLCFSSHKNAVQFMSRFDENMAKAKKTFGRD